MILYMNIKTIENMHWLDRSDWNQMQLESNGGG